MKAEEVISEEKRNEKEGEQREPVSKNSNRELICRLDHNMEPAVKQITTENQITSAMPKQSYT